MKTPVKPNYAVFYLGSVIYTLIGVILVLILFGCSVSRESMTGKEYVRYQQSQGRYDINK